MHGYSIAIVAVLSSAAASLPARVHACSCKVEPIYHSQPAAESKNVPRDIAPIIEGPFDPSTVTFEDEQGVKPPFKLQVGPRVGCLGGWAELLPQQPLAANTRYTIRVDALHPEALTAEERVGSISFTTGSDQLADQPLMPPPLAAASILRGAPDCGGLPKTFACIGGLEQSSPTDLELIARRGDKILLRITSLIHDDSNYAIEEQPDCIELRRRAADGRRSEPTTICGTALPARDYRASDKRPNGWVECRDGIVGAPNADDQNVDGGASTEAVLDASVASGDPARDADASSSRAARPTPSNSGCSALTPRSEHLPGLLPVASAFAVLLSALRRRKRG